MEQHPVPQNVTSFQFKLIGDITLKQFVYLAGGIILGYISLKIPLIPTLLRWPTAGFFGLFGIGLAFVPIEERPLDRWLAAFVKSIYSPTQFIWKKDNQPPEVLLTTPAPIPVSPTPTPTTTGVPAANAFTTPRPAPMRLHLPSTPTVPPPKAEKRGFDIPPQTPTSIKPPVPTLDRWTIGAPVPTATLKSPEPTAAAGQVSGKRVVFEEKKPAAPQAPLTDQKQIERIKTGYEQTAQKLNDQIRSLQTELAEGTIAKERLLELQQLLMQLAGEKERLSRELVELKQKMATGEKRPAIRPSGFTSTPSDPGTAVKMVTPQTAYHIGLPKLTSAPNVVTGIIKDSKGLLLTNLIIMVKDRDGIPVRALKSNKLGQFAASTPLSNGVYVLEIEDPKKTYQFERIEVSLEGQVLAPLEIYAISEKDIMRQKLTREIFGVNGI